MAEMRFECQPGCTACCEQKGFVYLTEEDVSRIAAYLKMRGEDFERRYIYRTKNLRRLRVPSGAQCPFLQGRGCGIHSVKPVQCRTFPFWPEIVESRKAWQQTAAWCPGIGKGGLVQIEIAQAGAREMRAAYPGMY